MQDPTFYNGPTDLGPALSLQPKARDEWGREWAQQIGWLKHPERLTIAELELALVLFDWSGEEPRFVWWLGRYPYILRRVHAFLMKRYCFPLLSAFRKAVRAAKLHAAPFRAGEILPLYPRMWGIVTVGALALSGLDIAQAPFSKHLDAYERHLRAKCSDPRRISMLRKRIERLVKECRFPRLNKLAPGPVERWLAERADGGMSAATRNGYREALICFANWCRRTNRLTRNPFTDLPRADQNSDRRHQRRALTEAELLRLLKTARLRPLAEYGRKVVARKPSAKRALRCRATWTRGPLTYEGLDAAAERARAALQANPDLVAELERIGRERGLIYKTLVLTGLRKGELASLTVSQVELDGTVAYAVLNPADEKNRRGANIPLRVDLAAEIGDWLADRLKAAQDAARAEGAPIPARLPASTPLFRVPSGLTRIFDRDLVVAGIPKRDDRNRVVDIHALRVTFGTHLCAAGVPLRTAQAAMRHSKPELTANIYTDPKLLDVAGAINALPALAAAAEQPKFRQAMS